MWCADGLLCGKSLVNCVAGCWIVVWLVIDEPCGVLMVCFVANHWSTVWLVAGLLHGW